MDEQRVETLEYASPTTNARPLSRVDLSVVLLTLLPIFVSGTYAYEYWYQHPPERARILPWAPAYVAPLRLALDERIVVTCWLLVSIWFLIAATRDPFARRGAYRNVVVAWIAMFVVGAAVLAATHRYVRPEDRRAPVVIARFMVYWLIANPATILLGVRLGYQSLKRAVEENDLRAQT